MTNKQVLVNVDDLRILRTQHELGGNRFIGNTITFQYAIDSTPGKAISRLVAAIPEPDWEPPEGQMVPYAKAFGYQLSDPIQARAVRSRLKRLHDAGLLPPTIYRPETP